MSDDDGSNSRSERLRRRREQRSEQSEPSERDEPSKPSKLSKQSEPETESGSVKDEQVGTYMYIPESQKKELERLYNILKAEYEYEYDGEFQKNRHFYPLLVQHGLEGLEGLDASELQEHLESTN